MLLLFLIVGEGRRKKGRRARGEGRRRREEGRGKMEADPGGANLGGEDEKTIGRGKFGKGDG